MKNKVKPFGPTTLVATFIFQLQENSVHRAKDKECIYSLQYNLVDTISQVIEILRNQISALQKLAMDLYYVCILLLFFLLKA